MNGLILLLGFVLVKTTVGNYTWYDISGTNSCLIGQDDVTSDTTGVTQAQCEINCDADTYCAAYQHDSDTDRCVLLDSCFLTTPGIYETAKLKNEDSYTVTLGYGCDGTPTLHSQMAGYDCYVTCRDNNACLAYVYDENFNRCLTYTSCATKTAYGSRVIFEKPTPAPTNAPTNAPTPPTPAPTFGPTYVHTFNNLTTSYCDPSRQVISTTTEETLNDCYNLCTGDDTCGAYLFDEDSGTCKVLEACYALNGNGGYEHIEVKSFDDWPMYPGYVCTNSPPSNLINGISGFSCFTTCRDDSACNGWVYDGTQSRCLIYDDCSTPVLNQASRITFTKPTPAPTESPTPAPTPDPYIEVGKAYINFNVKSASTRKTVAKNTIADVKAKTSNPNNVLFSVKTIETSAVSTQFFNNIGNETLFKEKFAAARGCNPGECTVTVDTGARRLLTMSTRDLQQEYTVEIEFTFSEADYNSFTDLNTTIGDPAFITALANELGVSEQDIDITAVGGTVTLEVTLTATVTDEPSGEDSLADLQEVQNSLNNATTILVQQLGDPEDGVQTVTLDLCGSRDCNGFGDSSAPNTDSNGCNPSTGVCTCTAESQRWGINCESECECFNGGVCKKNMCHCQYPFYGLKCGQNKTLDCSACGL